MQKKELSAMEKMENMLKGFWKKHGNPHYIVGRHTEFVVEPRVFMGNKLNPEVLNLLIQNYLACAAADDSGVGKVKVKDDKLVITTPKGKPLAIIRDKKLIEQYLAQRA
jgi:hypothetical protein